MTYTFFFFNKRKKVFRFVTIERLKFVTGVCTDVKKNGENHLLCGVVTHL